MSSNIETAKRRSALLLATSILALSGSLASAQTPPTSPAAGRGQPAHRSRTRPAPGRWRATAAAPPRPARTARPSRGAGTGTSDGASPGIADGSGTSTGGRQFNGIVGTSSSVITAQDIAHSPSNNLPDILAQVPGVQLTSAVRRASNGAKTSVDLRGFGAFATSNTLILVNGRRLNDVDMAQVDLSTIPLQFDRAHRNHPRQQRRGALRRQRDRRRHQHRPEERRRRPAGRRSAPRPASARSTRASPTISAATNYGPWSTSFYGNAIKSDGYRDNNALDQTQRRRQPQLHDARPQGVPDRHRRRPEARLPRRPHGRSLDRPQPTRHQPQRHQHAVRLRQPAGRQRDRRLHQDHHRRRRPDRRWRRARQETARRVLRHAADHSLQLRRQPSADLVDHAAPEHQELDVRRAVADPDRHRLLRCDLQFRTGRCSRARSRSTSTICRSRSLAGYWQHTIGLLPTTDFSYGARVQNTMPQRARSPESQRTRLPSASKPRRSRSTAAKPTTRCMSVLSIASTTCSRYSAAPRTHSARRTSRNASPPDPCCRLHPSRARPRTSG